MHTGRPSSTVEHKLTITLLTQALQLLIQEVSYTESPSDALTAAILLSSYEVLAASDAPYRSHKQGAMHMIKARGVSASSVGLDRANFLVYIRHEITIALANGSMLQLDPMDWNVPKPEIGDAEDRMAIYLMWLVGKAVNLVHGDREGGSTTERKVLMESVEGWYMGTNTAFRGIPYGETNEEGMQKVFFSIPAAGTSRLVNQPCSLDRAGDGYTRRMTLYVSRERVL